MKITINSAVPVGFSNIYIRESTLDCIVHLTVAQRTQELAKALFYQTLTLFNNRYANAEKYAWKTYEMGCYELHIPFNHLIIKDTKISYLDREEFQRTIFSQLNPRESQKLFDGIDLSKTNFQKVSPYLLNNKNFVRPLVNIDVTILYYVSEELLDNDDFMEEMAFTNIHTLFYASRRLLNCPKFMEIVARSNIDSLIYATRELITNEEFMEKVIDINPKAFSYAAPIFKIDLFFIKKMARKNIEIMKYLPNRSPEDLLHNSSFMKEMIQYNIHAFNCPSFLRHDIYFIEKMAALNIHVLGYACDQILKSRDFMKEMSHIHPDALKYAHPSLKNDAEWWKTLNLTEEMFKYIPKQVLATDVDLCMKIARTIKGLDNQFTNASIFKTDITFITHTQ